MEVPILKQGLYLIASIQAALSDVDLLHLRDALAEKVGKFRARGVIVDVTVLDVMDSFSSRTLRDLAHMTRLRGAETVIVGYPAGSCICDGSARIDAGRSGHSPRFGRRARVFGRENEETHVPWLAKRSSQSIRTPTS